MERQLTNGQWPEDWKAYCLSPPIVGDGGIKITYNMTSKLPKYLMKHLDMPLKIHTAK